MTNTDTIMQEVRDLLMDHDVALLSARVGVSKSAIYAIINGKTKWPRPHTLNALLWFVGRRLSLGLRPATGRAPSPHAIPHELPQDYR